MTGYNKRNGAYMTKEDKKADAIFGIRKALEIGNYDKVMLLEKELHNVYGMTYDEIENAMYN